MKNTYETSTSGSFFRYFVVIVAAAVTTFGIIRISSALTQNSTSFPAPAEQTADQKAQTIFRTVSEPADASKKYEALTSQVSSDSVPLSELNTIPTGKYGTMFKLATDVEDYYGNQYSKAYLLYGDGIVGDYNKAVKFRNDNGYSWLKGQIVLENTDYNERGMEYGYMKVILMDIDGNEIDSTQEINDKSSKKADMNFYIGDLDEFMIAVDCTDGRAGGSLMTLIANDFIVTK